MKNDLMNNNKLLDIVYALSPNIPRGLPATSACSFMMGVTSRSEPVIQLTKSILHIVFRLFALSLLGLSLIGRRNVIVACASARVHLAQPRYQHSTHNTQNTAENEKPYTCNDDADLEEQQEVWISCLVEVMAIARHGGPDKYTPTCQNKTQASWDEIQEFGIVPLVDHCQRRDQAGQTATHNG
jgi:hypothetical protein